MFFEKDEIVSTKQNQDLDLFDDIHQHKLELLVRGDPKVNNKIIIEDFAPFEDQKLLNQNTRKSKGRSMKGSHTGDMLEDRQDHSNEVNEAL